MLERHLDGTVLIRQAAGGIFKPLERSDLLITDADRTPSRCKDRDAALIGKLSLSLFQSKIRHYRYNHGDAYFSRSSLLLPCDSSTSVFLSFLFFLISIGIILGYHMPTISHRSRDINFCEKYDGMAWKYEDVGEVGTNGRQNQNNETLTMTRML
jgi:cleavage and polyadenylation specificity factor subunit 2